MQLIVSCIFFNPFQGIVGFPGLGIAKFTIPCQGIAKGSQILVLGSLKEIASRVFGKADLADKLDLAAIIVRQKPGAPAIRHYAVHICRCGGVPKEPFQWFSILDGIYPNEMYRELVPRLIAGECLFTEVKAADKGTSLMSVSRPLTDADIAALYQQSCGSAEDVNEVAP